MHDQAQHCFVTITELINFKFLTLIRGQKLQWIYGYVRIADVG